MRIRPYGMVFLLVVLLAASTVPASALTYVNRHYWTDTQGNQHIDIVDVTYTTDTVWNTAGSPYVCEGNISVATGATLTVQSGVTANFGGNLGLFVSGNLSATGASFGTLGGYWKGIYLSPASGGSSLVNSTIDHAGAFNNGYGMGYWHGDNRRSAIYVDTCNPTITGCTISNFETHGITLWSSKATLQNNSFTNTPANYFAVVYNTTDCFPTLSGNSSTGPGSNGIAWPGGEITVNGTWNRPGTDFPYFTGGELALNAANTLTLDPGVTVKSGYTRFLINGTLLCNGTSTLPVTFTSSAATPAPGNWRGIYFAPTAGASNLKYTSVLYAGAFNNGYGLGYFNGDNRLDAMYVDTCNPIFSNLTVSNTEMNAMELVSSNSPLTNVTFGSNGHRAMILRSNSRPTITTASFTNNTANGNYVIGMDASCVPTISGTTFSGNKYQGIEIWGGTLPTSGTWQNWSNNAPYVITVDTTVAPGATLTIEQGTGIQAAGTGLYVGGTLLADGTPNRIRFTSAADDTLFGDINGDGAASTPAAGNWKGIYLSPASGGSILRNADVRFSGAFNNGFGLGYWNSDNRQTALYVNDCDPIIQNCVFSDFETHGITLWSSRATIQNNTFINTPVNRFAMVYNTTDCFPTASGNASTGAGYNGIAWPGGVITVNGTWNRPGTDFPYFTGGDITLNAANTLTIDPGVTVKNSGTAYFINGTILSNGTSTLPVTFTSSAVSPAPGNWRGIYLAPTAGASKFQYSSLFYGGAFNNGFGTGYWHGDNRQTALFVDSCSPVFSNFAIRSSEMHAMMVWESNASMTNSTFDANGHRAMILQSNSRPTITTASFTNNTANGNYVLGMDASCVPTISGTTFSGNKYQGIEIWGGTLPTSGTWQNWSNNAPYVITVDTTVAAGATLTIEQGTGIQAAGTGLYVGGTLLADGTPNRIRFTSAADDTLFGDINGDGAASTPAAGNWKGIYLSPASGGSILRNAEIRYSGAFNNGYGLGNWNGDNRQTALYVNDCDPVIQGCVLADSQTQGITLWSSRATVQDNTFINTPANYYAMVFNSTDCFPVMSGNSSTGAGNNGVAWPGGVITVNGTWNRPGTDFPYFINGHLTLNAANTLTLDPGVTLKNSFVGLYFSGTLFANGTAALPVTMTTRNASPAPGAWLGVYLGPGAGASTLKFTKVLYSGAFSNGYGLGYWNGDNQRTALYIDANSARISDLTLQFSETDAVALFGTSARIASGLITNSAGWGVRVAGADSSILSNLTIARNGGGTLQSGGAATLANSIVAFNTTGYLPQAGALNAVYSDVFGNTNGDYLPAGTGNMHVDPLFMGASDYHLQATSTLINKGSYAYVGSAYDLDGNGRAQGPAPDMGAYEFGVANSFGIVDVISALKIAGGLVKSTGADLTRLNLAPSTPSKIDLLDCVKAARKMVGLETNP